MEVVDFITCVNLLHTTCCTLQLATHGFGLEKFFQKLQRLLNYLIHHTALIEQLNSIVTCKSLCWSNWHQLLHVHVGCFIVIFKGNMYMYMYVNVHAG